jgi:CheY-like chemotaxis protein
MGEHQTRLCILVVEGDALIGMLLEEMVVGLGHGVCGVVTTESDAVSAAARYRPHLMLVDVDWRTATARPRCGPSSRQQHCRTSS